MTWSPLGVLLLAFPAQDGTPPPPALPQAPFTMELPEGYGAFEREPTEFERWAARRGDGFGVFKIEHYLLAAPGASSEATGEQVLRIWRQQLAGAEASIEPWTGTWAGRPAGGGEVRYKTAAREGAALERVVVIEDHLVHAVWEGVPEQLPAALAALDSFELPAEWIPLPPPEVDPWRGLGEAGAAKPFPGALRVNVDLSGLDGQQAVVVEVVWDAPDGMEPGGWVLPPAAVEMEPTEKGRPAARYRLRVDDGAGRGSPYGMLRAEVGQGLAALDASWVAVPRVLLEEKAGYQPPPWTLRLAYAAHLTALSHGPGQTEFDEAVGLRRTTFAPFAGGHAWPYYVVAMIEPRQDAGRTWALRKDAKATVTDELVRGLNRLEEAQRAWLPHAPPQAMLLSYPGTGDRMLPGLLVLDEEAGWFEQPLDTTREGLTRRTWLARTLAAGTFGAGLRGLGSGAPVLEAALSEYAAWRILEQAWPEDAAALQASWEAREEALGMLPRPLSMMPPEDAFGARRLHSRGPLVWQAIERRAGRDKLDAVLDAALAAGTPWSTRDLEAALAAATATDWSAFFRDYVYGRLTPPAAR